MKYQFLKTEHFPRAQLKQSLLVFLLDTPLAWCVFLSCDFRVLDIFICTAFGCFSIRIPKILTFLLEISIVYSLLMFVEQNPPIYLDRTRRVLRSSHMHMQHTSIGAAIFVYKRCLFMGRGVELLVSQYVGFQEAIGRCAYTLKFQFQ